MGKKYSCPLPQSTPNCPYFVMVIRPSKALVLIFADDNVKSIITNRLCHSWPAGRKGDQNGTLHSDGSYEYILKGSPFSDCNDPNKSALINLLFCQLLTDLKAAGWHLISCTKDLSQPTPNSARSTLFFRKISNNHHPTADNHVICVCSGDEANILRFVNMKKEMVSDLADTIEPSGICRLVDNATYGSGSIHEVLMDESLWGDGESIYSRRVIIKIFHHLHLYGYTFCASVNFDGISDCAYFERSTSSQVPNHIQDPDQSILEEDEDADMDGSYDRLRAMSMSSTSSSTNSIHFMIIDMHKCHARFRVIRAQMRMIFMIRSLISSYWPHGLRSMTRLDVDAYEFVVATESGSDEKSASITGNSAILICQLIQILSKYGWQLIASLDLCQISDRWTLVFHDTGGNVNGSRNSTSGTENGKIKGLNGNGRPQALNQIDGRVWCICMSGPSTITILNARPDIKHCICELVSKCWPRGIKNVVEFAGNRRIRMVGQPWIPSVHTATDHRANEDLLSRGLMCMVLSELIENFECQPLCVVSIAWKTGSNEKNQLSDVHCCWFFIDPFADQVDDQILENARSIPGDAKFQRRSTIS